MVSRNRDKNVMHLIIIASGANQDFNLLGDSFSNRDNVRAPIQLNERDNTSILKDHFSPRMDPSIH